MIHKGSCLCGEISFEIDGTFDDFFLCHCGYCRKDSGSAHSANLFSSTAELKWLSGEQKVRIFQYKSSGHIKSFCPVCGSGVPHKEMNGNLLVVPAGCLHTDPAIKPTAHIFWEKRAGWDNELEKVFKFSHLPDKSNTED